MHVEEVEGSPVSHKLGQLGMTVASQQLDGVGGGHDVCRTRGILVRLNGCEAGAFFKKSKSRICHFGPRIFFASRDCSPPLAPMNGPNAVGLRTLYSALLKLT